MKDKTDSSRSDKQSPVLRGVLPALCVVLAVFAFAVQPPADLFRGFWRILISDAGLITDPAVTGGAGAALLNAALVLALSAALVYGMHLPVTGLTFACLFMMAGFSLLGKNILNILPVLLGGWLYARFQGEPFSKYVYQTLFATCLSPLVSSGSCICRARGALPRCWEAAWPSAFSFCLSRGTPSGSIRALISITSALPRASSALALRASARGWAWNSSRSSVGARRTTWYFCGCCA